MNILEQIHSGKNAPLKLVGEAMSQRRAEVAKVAQQSAERMLTALVAGSDPHKLQDEAFAVMLRLSRNIGGYTELIETLNEPRLEITLDEFRGVI